MVRAPSPPQWIWYAYGGRLPDRYRDWVWHDTTSSGWFRRQLLRILVKAIPFFCAGFVVLYLATPLPWPASLVIVLFGLLLSVIYTSASAAEFCDARLAKHGLPPGSEIRPHRGS